MVSELASSSNYYIFCVGEGGSPPLILKAPLKNKFNSNLHSMIPFSNVVKTIDSVTLWTRYIAICKQDLYTPKISMHIKDFSWSTWHFSNSVTRPSLPTDTFRNDSNFYETIQHRRGSLSITKYNNQFIS